MAAPAPRLEGTGSGPGDRYEVESQHRDIAHGDAGSGAAPERDPQHLLGPLVARATDPVWVLENDGEGFRCVAANDAYVALHGLGGAPAGRSIEEFLSVRVAAETSANARAAPEMGSVRFDLHVESTDGPVDLEVRLDHVDHGGRAYVVGIGRDLSAHRAHERELRRVEEVLRASEARLTGILDLAQDAIVSVDRHGDIVLYNQAAARIFGYEPHEAIGSALDIVLPDRFAGVHRRWVEASLREGLPAHFAGATREIAARRKNGTEFPAEISMSRLETTDGALITMILRDVTDRKQSVEALVASERFNRSVLDSIGALTAVVDTQGNVVATNRAWRDFAVKAGANESVGMGANYLEVALGAASHDAAGAAEVAAGLQAVLDGHCERFSADYPCPRPDGERWFTLEIESLAAVDGGAVVSHHEITERKRIEAALAHQSLHDPLTGLPNRILLVDRIEQALARNGRRRSHIAVMLLDLDRFKVVNDSLGHAVGDELLGCAAERLEAVLRAGDTVARFSGDEFAVLCEDLGDATDAERAASRLVDAFAEPFSVRGRNLHVTVSIGIAIATTDSATATADKLIRNADTAMYRAKEQGRARYVFFDQELRRRAVTRLELEHDLADAIGRDELRLHYQPQYDLTDGRVVGAEALLRWDHPVRGAVSPAEFIPVAEETGMIVPLGAWVLREACATAAGWCASRAVYEQFTISVNLSARQLTDPGLLTAVGAALDGTGLRPGQLYLEITETAVMHDTDATIGILHDLQRLGVRLALDDFGTGHASLGYLSRFAIDVLKIDRSFVRGLGRDRGDTAIVASIVALAAALGLDVVAEGIEELDQLTRLQELGCRYGQGFLLARPVPPGEVEPLLATTGGW